MDNIEKQLMFLGKHKDTIQLFKESYSGYNDLVKLHYISTIVINYLPTTDLNFTLDITVEFLILNNIVQKFIVQDVQYIHSFEHALELAANTVRNDFTLKHDVMKKLKDLIK